MTYTCGVARCLHSRDARYQVRLLAIIGVACLTVALISGQERPDDPAAVMRQLVDSGTLPDFIGATSPSSSLSCETYTSLPGIRRFGFATAR